MSDIPEDNDEKKGDEVLRRLLKTPPDPKTGKGEKRKEDKDAKGQSRDR
jgi:hypothetical protein